MNTKVPIAFGIALLASSCGRGPVEVDHPFYIWAFDETASPRLVRCPERPESRKYIGCAGDGLPGPRVDAAGADDRFIVVRQTPEEDPSLTRYYFFERVPQEAAEGRGRNPERIIGPLDQRAFEEAKARLNLPDFSITP